MQIAWYVEDTCFKDISASLMTKIYQLTEELSAKNTTTFLINGVSDLSSHLLSSAYLKNIAVQLYTSKPLSEEMRFYPAVILPASQYPLDIKKARKIIKVQKLRPKKGLWLNTEGKLTNVS